MIRKILIICVLLFFACANSHKPKLTNIDILEFYDDLNSNDIDAAVKIIAGTARSMGVETDL